MIHPLNLIKLICCRCKNKMNDFTFGVFVTLEFNLDDGAEVGEISDEDLLVTQLREPADLRNKMNMIVDENQIYYEKPNG